MLVGHIGLRVLHRRREPRQTSPPGERWRRSRFASRDGRRGTVARESCERSEQDGIIIERRSSGGGGRGPSRRDIEFPQGLLRRYFFLRLNLSFFRCPPLASLREPSEIRRKGRGERWCRRTKRTIAITTFLCRGENDHAPPLSLSFLPSPSSLAAAAAAQIPLLLPFCRFVKRGYPKNLARLSFTRVPFRVGGDRGSFPGSL